MTKSKSVQKLNIPKVNLDKGLIKNDTKTVVEAPYEYQSKLAKVSWDCESELPKPMLDTKILQPAVYLADILQYARGAESRGEYLFRTKWLMPYIRKYVKVNVSSSYWEDVMGNIVVHIGGSAAFDTLHVGHVDTVHSDDKSPLQHIGIRAMGKHGNSKFKDDREVFLHPVVKNSVAKIKTGVRWINDERLTHEYIEYELVADRGSRCLGADDGCAVAMMLWMMQHQVAGTYMFTRGEERGCIGTRFMMEKEDLNFSLFKRAIEVDRKGETEIITKMSPGITASKTFAENLATALGMGHSPSDKGSITDVGHLAKKIPECVNLAAGYLLQHSERETTNVDYLNRLGKAMIAVDWNGLDTTRKANEFTVKVQPINKSNNNVKYGSNRPYQGGYTHYTSQTQKNKFGDYTELDFKSEKILFEDCINQYEVAGFIRANTGLIGEFLAALDISLKDIDDVCTFGLENHISAYDPEIEDDVEETDELGEKIADDVAEALIAIEAEETEEIIKQLDLEEIRKIDLH